MMGPGMIQGITQIVPETANIKAHEITKPVADYNAMIAQGQKNIEKKQEQVIKKDDPALSYDKFDAKEKGSNEYSYSGQKGKKKEKDGTVVLKEKKQGFDIKI